MVDNTIQASLQARLGQTKFAQDLQSTLTCKTARNSFKLYLVTVQHLERYTIDNLLALRGLLYAAQSSTVSTKATPLGYLRENFSSLQAQVTSLRSKSNSIKANNSNHQPHHANFNSVIQKFDSLLKVVNSESSNADKKHSEKSSQPEKPPVKQKSNAFTSLFRKNSTSTNSLSTTSSDPVQDLLRQVDSFFDAYFTPYQRSELYARYQFKYFNQPYRLLSLADILSHDVASVAFSDFLELEQASGILDFLYSVSAYQESFPESTEEQRQRDAMQIYMKFVSMQAEKKVGFGDKIRHNIETRICVEEGEKVGFECFESAEQQALTTLNSVFFPAFRASTIYTNFLQDMLRGCRLLSNDEDKNGGIISATDFEETQSNSSMEKQRRKSLSVAQQLDEDYYLRQLANPDILWHRLLRCGKFRSIGSVDSLGRFTLDHDLKKYLIRHQQSLDVNKNNRKLTTSGLELDEEFIEKSHHVQVRQMSDFQDSGRFAKVFKKFVGIGAQHPAEEQDLAASMAKEFLHNLLTQNEFLS